MRQAVEITIVAKCDVDAVNSKAVIESNCTDALAVMLPLQPVNDCFEILAFEIQGTREEAEIFGNDESKSSSYPFPLFVAWGERPDGESVARIDFASERERTAYKEGISDADGWLAGAVSTDSDSLLQYLDGYCGATPENMEQARASFASPAPFGEPIIEQADVLDAALCLWEEFLARFLNSPRRPDSPLYTAIDKYRNDNGICALRQLVASWAEPCHRDWERAVAGGYDDIFDWEFCPTWLDKALRKQFNQPEGEANA